MKKIDIFDKKDIFGGNVFRIIDREWGLICAGTPEEYNMMTASWMGFGILWYKPVAFIFIRHSRHTYRFIEKHDSFSINFFDKKYKNVLQFCGSVSGRDVNKMEKAGLTPITESNTVYFKESRLAFICKKLYFHDINADNFIIPEIGKKHYSDGDYHRMYIGEILSVIKGE